MTVSASPASTNAVRTLDGLDPRALPDDVLRSTEPLLLRGLVADWPMVAAARNSDAAAMAYLRSFYQGAPVVVMVGKPDIGGRFFYNEDLSGFNFRREKARLDAVLAALDRHAHDPKPPGFYVGSTTIDTCLPGLRQANDLDLGPRLPLASIWIGNRTRIAAHQDVPDNIACVVAGRRRFTLFPPEQLRNLYIGPLDLTPAGQSISLVDFANPDLQAHPRFAEAMANAQVAELAPGDAIFIPSLWWHHVESLESYNVLVNYWWRQSPAYMDSPMNALMLALLSVRELPDAQRQAWAEIFRHYIFEPGEETAGHIPPAAQRLLGPLDPDLARGLRANLLNRINR
jgi:hypothetical protein